MKNHFPSGLVLLLVLSASLFFSWALAVPIMEGPDEPSHWQYIFYVHQNGKPPPYGNSYSEANQPPLYYLLAAPFASASATPRSTSSRDDQGNFHTAGTNLFEHSTRDFDLYSPLYAIRFLTIGFAVLAILFTYWVGFEASGKATIGLLAAGLLAFLPQFTSRGMNISNDALLTMLCAMATFWIVRVAKRGFNWQAGIAAGVTIGLAFLSRINAVILAVPLGLALISQKTPWRARLGSFAVLMLAAIIAIPWLVSNQIQYGDPLAMRVLTTIVAAPWTRPKPITSPYFLNEFPGALYESFVGRFGFIMDVPLPNWLYTAFGLFFLTALAGLVWRVIHQPGDRKLLLVLLVIPFLSLGTIIYLNLTFSIPFGRYLFPALPALATLAAMGLESLPGWSDDLALATLAELFLVNAYILETVVIPAHRLGI